MNSFPAPAWSCWQRGLFRYLSVHWALYAFCDPQGNPLISLMSVIRFWLGKITGWGAEWRWWAEDLDLTSWTQPVVSKIADLQGTRSGAEPGWWLRLTSWLSEQSAMFGSDDAPLFVVVHNRTGSGDTMHDWVKFACIVVASVVLAGLWSYLGRGRSYPRLGRWVHLGARWYLALSLLSYGLAKFYGMTQFPVPGISMLTRQVGDHSPMGLVWTFLGASEPYKYFGGAGELLGFALLLHHRTVLAGAFVTIGVMANVCALNWLYGIPVKLYSSHLLLIAVFLLAPFWQRLWALFVSNRFSESVDLRVVRGPLSKWTLLLFGCLWAVGLVWQAHESRTRMWQSESMAKRVAVPELFGLWEVERMLLDGQEVPMSDASRWRYLAIDRGHVAWSETLAGSKQHWRIEEDLAAGRITLRGLAPAAGGDSAPAQTWTIERSTVTRRVRHPAPSTSFGQMTEADRQAIVWRGAFGDRQLELHTVQKVFRLHDGFRLVREFPR